MTSPATIDDVPWIARLHAEAFPESIRSWLGPAWLAAEYREALDRDDRRMLVADGAGFVTVILPVSHGAARRAARPFAAALTRLATDRRLLRFAAALVRMAQHRRPAPPAPLGAAAIDYVAVSPPARGLGIADQLMAAALAHWPGRWYVTTTVDNAPALALYERHGFQRRELWPGYDGREYVRLHRGFA